MQPKHIAMIIDGLPGGGAERVVLTLCAGLIKQGHRVSVISLREVCEYPLPEGINYYPLTDRCRSPWRKLTELTRRARALDQQVTCINKQMGQFDLVLSHLHKTDRIVRRSQRLPQHKIWHCLHGVLSCSYLGKRQGLSRWLKRFKIKQIYQQRNILAVSPAVLDDLLQTFSVQPKQAQVIFNPFDSASIRKQAQVAPPPLASPYLLHVGRLHPTKRHDRLLRAYALSQLSLPLVLLGQGSLAMKQQLEQLAIQLNIKDKVIFQGFDSNPYRWINAAQMLILSSDSEGFGNVLVEALICQTQIVSTNCPGGPAAIMQGDLSRGLADLTAESLSEKMVEIYQHPVELHADMVKNFELNHICQQYLRLIS